MKKKKILRIILVCFSVLIVFTSLLVTHIYMMVSKPKNNNTGKMIQLSRIDFNEKIDSVEAKKIVHFVSHLEGVNKAYFNVRDCTLVYGYLREKQNSTNVYDQLMSYGHYKAKRFIVDSRMLASGCPAMDNKSFSYRISSGIAKLFN